MIPSPRNARTHNPGQIAEIAGSIRAFGFTNPILVGENGDVVAGHGRLAAARQLGLGEVPVIPLVGLTELERRQLILADNRIALNSGWDLEMLSLELKDLSGLGVDLSSLGFSSKELAEALSSGERERRPHRRKRGPSTQRHCRYPSWRYLVPRSASAGVRRQH